MFRVRHAVSLSSIAAGVLLWASTSYAQTDTITNVWNALAQHCGPVIQKQAVVIADFENLPNEHRLSQSADGRRVQIDHQTQDLQWTVSAAQSELGGKRMIYCTVSYHNLQQIADVEQMTRDLVDRLKASGATEVVGGNEKVVKISPLYASPGSGIDQTGHIDAFGLLPSNDMFLQFQVFGYGLSATVLGILPLSGAE